MRSTCVGSLSLENGQKWHLHGRGRLIVKWIQVKQNKKLVWVFVYGDAKWGMSKIRFRPPRAICESYIFLVGEDKKVCCIYNKLNFGGGPLANKLN